MGCIFPYFFKVKLSKLSWEQKFEVYLSFMINFHERAYLRKINVVFALHIASVMRKDFKEEKGTYFQDNIHPWIIMFLNKFVVQGMDVIAQAQSGTGKTATFSISILQQIDTGLRECQVRFKEVLMYLYRYLRQLA